MSPASQTPGLCRDCTAPVDDPLATRCPACRSPRIIRHPELHSLFIAHIDCDAFYASVEKRDRPELASTPVIVGGGHRGVVAACCYLARLKGVRSAMPMYQARKRCPEAVVIRPDMERYRIAGEQVRNIMEEATPLVEPLSIDEAFLDLSGTERLHHGSAAHTLLHLVKRIEEDVGVTASVGLSYNKFLAKIASDLDKPRGFAVIGRQDADDFLASRPVSLLWGVGKALCATLENDGIRTIGQLRAFGCGELVRRYGSIGVRLYDFARGEDDRSVIPYNPVKSISNETTLDSDLSDLSDLRHKLWTLCEKVSARLKAAGLSGQTVTLKLKTSAFRLITRSRRLHAPTQLAETLFRTALPILEAEADGRAFRLIGVGAADFKQDGGAFQGDLLDDAEKGRQAKVEMAMDAVRNRFGQPAIVKGRSLPPGRKDS
ncbi:MAG: DNA polymerase IV [Rhodospirillales bacterium]|nr:DNA polymerase IV [Rhodospirillales bacterium]MCW8969958.1 DNA polymerase IV [Rhodospirillales bacterium]MCW9002783.1 DNA polymerase IV [Rhodospirillales bacterium]